MFTIRVLQEISPLKRSFCKLDRLRLRRQYSKDPNNGQKATEIVGKDQKLGNIASKYKKFEEEDSEVIFDLYEERLKYSEEIESKEIEEPDPFEGINLERGMRGVFDIEDLIDVLKRENAQDIFVTAVPPHINYVDYICIVNGKSHRHMEALAQFVRKVYKRKCHENDMIPILEGRNSKQWMALDLGNIALHIFSKEGRAIYDLDSLWAVGPQYDKECNKEDPLVNMLEKHSVYLGDLQPAS